MHDPMKLLHIADKLGKVQAGSVSADILIGEALELTGAPLPFTRDVEAARVMLPPGFEEVQVTKVFDGTYVACRPSGRFNGFPHAHHGQWAATHALALCGAALKARAALAKAARHRAGNTRSTFVHP